MSLFSPFDPDFKSLHERGWSDAWWAVTFLLGAISAAIPALIVHHSLSLRWLTILVATVSYYWFISHALHLGWKERTVLGVDGQDLDSRIWAASRGQQVKLGFQDVGVYFGFKMLARPIGQETDAYDGHEFIVRDAKDTVAVANVIKIHDEAYWSAALYECLELDGEPVSLASVFEQVSVRARIRSAQAAKSDYVCIGLTTNSLETVGRGGPKMLASHRAQSLGEALLSYSGVDQKRSDFYAVALGQSLVPVDDPESDEARDQRSAVILAITRRQDISEILSLERVTEALIQNYKTDRIDLSNYELSDDVARQLREREIDFAGFT